MAFYVNTAIDITMPITPIGNARMVGQDFVSFGTNMVSHLEQAMVEWIVNEVLPQAKLDVPVRTGKLRGALAIVNVTRGPNMVSFIVGWGITAPYGKFQERGTRFIAARHFMKKAIQLKFPKINGFWISRVSSSEVGRYMAQGIASFTR